MSMEKSRVPPRSPIPPFTANTMSKHIHTAHAYTFLSKASAWLAYGGAGGAAVQHVVLGGVERLAPRRQRGRPAAARRRRGGAGGGGGDEGKPLRADALCGGRAVAVLRTSVRSTANVGLSLKHASTLRPRQAPSGGLKNVGRWPVCDALVCPSIPQKVIFGTPVHP